MEQTFTDPKTGMTLFYGENGSTLKKMNPAEGYVGHRLFIGSTRGGMSMTMAQIAALAANPNARVVTIKDPLEFQQEIGIPPNPQQPKPRNRAERRAREAQRRKTV